MLLPHVPIRKMPCPMDLPAPRSLNSRRLLSSLTKWLRQLGRHGTRRPQPRHEPANPGGPRTLLDQTLFRPMGPRHLHHLASHRSHLPNPRRFPQPNNLPRPEPRHPHRRRRPRLSHPPQTNRKRLARRRRCGHLRRSPHPGRSRRLGLRLARRSRRRTLTRRHLHLSPILQSPTLAPHHYRHSLLHPRAPIKTHRRRNAPVTRHHPRQTHPLRNPLDNPLASPRRHRPDHRLVNPTLRRRLSPSNPRPTRRRTRRPVPLCPQACHPDPLPHRRLRPRP